MYACIDIARRRANALFPNALLQTTASTQSTHCIKPWRFMAPNVTLVTTAWVRKKLIHPIARAPRCFVTLLLLWRRTLLRC